MDSEYPTRWMSKKDLATFCRVSEQTIINRTGYSVERKLLEEIPEEQRPARYVQTMKWAYRANIPVKLMRERRSHLAESIDEHATHTMPAAPKQHKRSVPDREKPPSSRDNQEYQARQENMKKLEHDVALEYLGKLSDADLVMEALKRGFKVQKEMMA